MKIPKTVQICGKTYNVKRDNTMWGGSGATGKQELVVGTSNDQSTERKFENYVHEVAEMVAAEECMRFTASDDEVVFVMNHKQFNCFAAGIATAIMPMVK